VKECFLPDSFFAVRRTRGVVADSPFMKQDLPNRDKVQILLRLSQRIASMRNVFAARARPSLSPRRRCEHTTARPIE
jgi:hypothetical protein